jgi:very-short-patch-repair endonuclease
MEGRAAVISHLEQHLALHLRALELPEPEQEYRFHPKRKWRFDMAYPGQRIAIEVEGGTFSNGRHTRGTGFTADCEKYNTAAIMGWCVLRFTGGMIESGAAVETVKAALEAKTIGAI